MQPPDMRPYIRGSAVETVAAEKPTATCSVFANIDNQYYYNDIKKIHFNV